MIVLSLGNNLLENVGYVNMLNGIANECKICHISCTYYKDVTIDSTREHETQWRSQGLPGWASRPPGRPN